MGHMESNKSINTIDTNNTFNELGADVSTLPSTLDPKSDDLGKLKDSLLSEAIAENKNLTTLQHTKRARIFRES